jgi:hypothetical protein
MIVLLAFSTTSCSLNSGFENCKEELVKSKDQLDSIAVLFLNQGYLSALNRRDYKRIPLGWYIHIFKPIKTEYIVIGKSLNNNTFKFEVEGDENIFFSQDYENIKSGNRNLKNFLDSQSISYEFFNLSRKFLFENDYGRIDYSHTDNAILINIGVLDGLLYSTKKGIEVNNPRYEELIPISENWYYFRAEAM